MEVSLLLCAEYATVSKDNKLSVMGISNHVFLPQFPSKYPQLYLVVQLRARPAEYGRKFKLGIRLIDQDAVRHLVDINVNLTIPNLKGVNKAEINHFVRLNNIEFPEEGPYEFSILIDNDIKGALPIEAKEIPKRQRLSQKPPAPSPYGDLPPNPNAPDNETDDDLPNDDDLAL